MLVSFVKIPILQMNFGISGQNNRFGATNSPVLKNTLKCDTVEFNGAKAKGQKMGRDKLAGEIENMLASKDRKAKIEYMEPMCEMATFILNELERQDVVDTSQLLLNAAMQENDEDLRRNYLHFVHRAVYPNTGIGLELEMGSMVKNLDKFPNNIRTLIDIAGTSGKKEFVSYLEPYLNHENEQVARKAQSAIDSINSRVFK